MLLQGSQGAARERLQSCGLQRGETGDEEDEREGQSLGKYRSLVGLSIDECTEQLEESFQVLTRNSLLPHEEGLDGGYDSLLQRGQEGDLLGVGVARDLHQLVQDIQDALNVLIVVLPALGAVDGSVVGREQVVRQLNRVDAYLLGVGFCQGQQGLRELLQLLRLNQLQQDLQDHPHVGVTEPQPNAAAIKEQLFQGHAAVDG